MPLHVLVEESSIRPVVERVVGEVVPAVNFEILEFPGKPNLLRLLPNRLKGYAHWPTVDPIRVLVVVDRDDDDCLILKQRLEQCAADAGLSTLSSALTGTAIVANRIVIEELEAWFFGDKAALRSAFPRLPAGLTDQARYRLPDSIRGGTAEALERELKRAGYPEAERRKTAIARRVAPFMSVAANTSPSFGAFVDGLRRVTSDIGGASPG